MSAPFEQCPSADEIQVQVCNRQQGLPVPPFQFGTSTPDGNFIGRFPGDIYTKTDTAKFYLFAGTPGTDTGWTLVN